MLTEPGVQFCTGNALGKAVMKCLENIAAEITHLIFGFDRYMVVLLHSSEYFHCFHVELKNFSLLSLI